MNWYQYGYMHIGVIWHKLAGKLHAFAGK